MKGKQIQGMRQGFAFQMRLAGLLEMPDSEYAALIRDIETDNIFMRLKYSENGAERAIRSRRLQQADLSHRFFELNEEVARDHSGGSSDIEKLLADKEKILEVIRKIGEEDFKRYFIFDEGELSLSEIAEACGLGITEAKEILWLVNSVDMYNEFFEPSASTSERAPTYNKIAVISGQAPGFTIQFTSAHWARGLYEVDYAKIERLSSEGQFSVKEKKNLKKLLEKIEFVNIRKSLMNTILKKILDKQSGYFSKQSREELVPFTQAELAKIIEVHPSIVSRSIAGRSIEAPWGEEKPLKDFFLSSQPRQKEHIISCIENILKEEHENLRNGLLKKPLSDKTIAVLLKEKYSILLAQRTVAKYRTELKLPSAFYRK